MTDLLRVSIVQSDLIWGNVKANLEHFSELFTGIQESVDLIILPEMFTSGFLMKDKHKIAPFASLTMEWMQRKAAELRAVIMGSIIVEEQGAYYNRLLVMSASGLIGKYDKRHLFRMGGEEQHFQPGQDRLIFRLGDWRICPLVCYDLRFPVWSRNADQYDLLIYVANWPQGRQEVWETLLKARAIENQCFTIGVNRVGSDEMKLIYRGGSCIIDAKGKELGKCKDLQSEIRTQVLDLNELKAFRSKFPVFLDADSFQVTR